jgi:predicted RND superfamily exporter protein
MWLTIAKVILRFRSVFIWLILVATYFMIQQSSNARLSYSMANLLPNKSAEQLDYNFFLEKFGIKDNIMIVGVDADSFFDYNNFQSWETLQSEIQKIDGVKSVYSISDAVDLLKDKKEKKLIIESLFDSIDNQSQLDEAFSKLKTLPFYRNTLYNDSASVMLLALDNDFITSDKRINLIDSIIGLRRYL